MRGVEGTFGGCDGGASRGLWRGGGSSLLIFLGQQRGRGLCLSWQTHLAGNCSDQTDNQSWKCMDKQKFTAPIGKVNRSRIRPYINNETVGLELHFDQLFAFQLSSLVWTGGFC